MSPTVAFLFRRNQGDLTPRSQVVAFGRGRVLPCARVAVRVAVTMDVISPSIDRCTGGRREVGREPPADGRMAKVGLLMREGLQPVVRYTALVGVRAGPERL
jgi:hypothetical protein